MKPHALICDLDMTLIDSRHDIAAGVAHAASTVAKIVVPEKLVFPWIGKSLRGMFVHFLNGAKEQTVDDCVAEYKRYFFDHCDVHTKIFPGVIQTLSSLQSKGIKTAVASAKMTFMAVRVCEKLGLAKHLDHIQGTDGFAVKPDPAVMIAAAKAIDADLARSVIVGDTVMDMKAAQKTGGLSVGVTWGIGTVADLEKEQPDIILDSFDRLENLF